MKGGSGSGGGTGGGTGGSGGGGGGAGGGVQITDVTGTAEGGGDLTCPAMAWETALRISRVGQQCTDEPVSSGAEGAVGAGAAAASKPAETTASPSKRLHDPALIAQWFQFGRYLLISSSRPGSQPANLQGIWADGPRAPWNGDYHLNINLQMCYWGAFSTNLAETTDPLGPWMAKLAEAGAATAKEYYDVDKGWVAHGFVDLWMDGAPHGDTQWSLCPTCGAWAALSLHEQYLYTRDLGALARDALPVLRGAVLFFEEYLVEATPELMQHVAPVLHRSPPPLLSG